MIDGAHNPAKWGDSVATDDSASAQSGTVATPGQPEQVHDDARTSPTSNETNAMPGIGEQDTVVSQRTISPVTRATLPIANPYLIGASLPCSWGRYQLRELLGRGGMGQVFLAWDPSLQREVALKILLGTEPEQVVRFQREAQAQARVDHPAVCKVYEVGDVDGIPYIAMQLVRGQSIKLATVGLPIERRVELMREAAEGVHAANRTGLIHRDLKPANILVEKTDDGRMLPFVVDFGLARFVDDTRVTVSGQVAGTPAYMAPEQIKGESARMNKRTDVYGLGVTFYEILTGCLPIEGGNPVEMMLAVVEQEVTPPRLFNPAIPQDLETIVLRCLEKDPARRYESARALAEDMGRFLDGEPIISHRSSLFYRWARKVRKHQVAARIAFVSALIVLVASAFAIRTGMMARKQTQLAEQFGREVMEAEAVIRHGYMLPRHDVTADEAQILTRLQRIEGQINELGDVAYGPGNYALGRGYLALRNWDRGLVHLQKAWEHGYRESAVAYALGLSQGRLFDKNAEEAGRITNSAYRDLRNAEIDQRFLIPAREYLRAGRGSSSDIPEYVEALLAFYDKNYSRTLECSEAAIKREPWLWEALHLASQVYSQRGQEARNAGRWDEALNNLTAYEKTLRRAEAIARSAPEVHEALCVSAVLRVGVTLEAGRDIGPAFRDADMICRTALEVWPTGSRILGNLAYADWYMAEYKRRRGEDPRQLLTEQINLAAKAAELGPGETEPNNILSLAYLSLGDEVRRRGEDPRAMYDKAIGFIRSAVAIDPKFSSGLNSVGMVHGRVAAWEREHGLDPMSRFQYAVESYQAAATSRPDWALPNSNLGAVLVDIGRYRMEQGDDPRPYIKKAVESLERSISINPQDRRPHNNIGWALRISADYVVNHGGDPTDDLDHAVRSFTQATTIDPSYALAWDNRGEALRRRCEYWLNTGRDPRSVAEEAQASFRKALEINSSYADAYYGLGEIYRVLAEYALVSGVNTSDFAMKGQEQLDKAIHVQSDLGGAFEEKARICLILSRERLLQGGQAEETLTRAARALAKAVSLNPRSFDACRLYGEVTLLQARAAVRGGRSSDALMTEAGRWLGKAMDLNPFDVDSLIDMAEVSRWQGEIQLARGGNPGAAVAAGLLNTTAAMTIFPNHPKALAIAGGLHQILAFVATGEERIRQEQESEKSFAQAFKINPFLKLEYGGENIPHRLPGRTSS